MAPKKVAIIGAGPSGLVTAKTLLRNFPHGTFSPIIFESQTHVGGLWSSSPHSADQVNVSPVTLDPRMRTNLSRFTVAFSDLAWESVIPDAEVPIFPQARQVGQYLACYTERYIPNDVLRLGSRVVRTTRNTDGAGPKWNVQWIRESAQTYQPEQGSLDGEVFAEDFDVIVIAMGYFAQQYIPNIPGLEQFTGPVIHSSTLHYKRETLFAGNQDKDVNGNIVVIGGSMSGVEATSAVALHQSSSVLSTSRTPGAQATKVHHIYSRPFWTLPTYFPHESAGGSPSFLPLDLSMYDLGRRPPGPIEYASGPVPEDKSVKTNSYFLSLLGNDYERYAHMKSPPGTNKSRTQPPWVAIGNDYGEFVRSGLIQPSMGRVVSVHPHQDTGLASIRYEGSDGISKTIDNVAAIVTATGFTPYKSLSLLPDEVLAILEYSKTDPFAPLILDKGGSVRSEIPDVGFVGFYRGPYWGVMEMQARFLGKLWSSGNYDMFCTTDNQKTRLRSLRLADPNLARGQFPMGDYVGLMESLAKDLEISRSALYAGDSQSGPVLPARYRYNKSEGCDDNDDDDPPAPDTEAKRTLDALRDTLLPNHDAAQKAATSAVFRALHGTWRYYKQTPSTTGEKTSFGTLAFYPRYPTSSAYDREYVCVKAHVDLNDRGECTQDKVQYIMRLAETGTGTVTSRIEIWSSGLTNNLPADQVTQIWELTPLCQKRRGDDIIPGEYVISAQSVDSVSGDEYLYTFHFEGVSILSWTCVELEDRIVKNKIDLTTSDWERNTTSYSYIRYSE